VKKTVTALWKACFEMNWDGDLRSLPPYLPQYHDGLRSVHSRDMYNRLMELATTSSHLGILTPKPHLQRIPYNNLWMDLVPLPSSSSSSSAREARKWIDYLIEGGHWDYFVKMLPMPKARKKYVKDFLARTARYGYLDEVQKICKALVEVGGDMKTLFNVVELEDLLSTGLMESRRLRDHDPAVGEYLESVQRAVANQY
jgi:hypothetical protein